VLDALPRPFGGEGKEGADELMQTLERLSQGVSIAGAKLPADVFVWLKAI